jgi:quercetin dioxygenase-like cupin family protein
MKISYTSVKFSFLCIFALFLVTNLALAQEATKADPAHYKVEFENDQVRVLRITYGAHEKSVMHEHAAGLLVFLTDGKGKFTSPDGKTGESSWKAGEVAWEPAIKHLPENLSDKPFELLLVEIKDKQEMSEKK